MFDLIRIFCCIPRSQPRPDNSGYVYIIQQKDVPDLFKIGKTKRDPKRRLKELQTGNPTELVIVYTIQSKNMHKLESSLHKKYEHSRVHGEWFRLPLSAVEEIRKTNQK
jgi:hypothetical protein